MAKSPWLRSSTNTNSSPNREARGGSISSSCRQLPPQFMVMTFVLFRTLLSGAAQWYRCSKYLFQR